MTADYPDLLHTVKNYVPGCSEITQSELSALMEKAAGDSYSQRADSLLNLLKARNDT